MAIAATVTQVTLAGTFKNYLGDAIAGQVQFTLSDMLRNSISDQMVVPSTIAVTLDSNGAFSVTLPSTNDPDIIPEFTYTVEEAFPDGRTYTIVLPADTSGTLNLADISPVPTIDTSYVGLVTEVPFATFETGVATLDTLITQATNEIPLSGEYWYIAAAYATYTEVNAAFATYTLLNAGTYPVSGSDLTDEIATADASASAAASSASSVATIVAGRFHPFLLIGG
jgi:hypothetical protein